MTNICFVQHAQSDISIHDDPTRPLTEKGKQDTSIVCTYLQNKNIDVVLSSPYKRAVDTVAYFADKNHLSIILRDDFRERHIGSIWIEDFNVFSQKQWADFTYKISEGESLGEVQRRNINALEELLCEYPGKNIVVGTHGTALSTILNYYDNSFNYDSFAAIVNIMPWIVKMTFDGQRYMGIEKVDVLSAESFL